MFFSMLYGVLLVGSKKYSKNIYHTHLHVPNITFVLDGIGYWRGLSHGSNITYEN